MRGTNAHKYTNAGQNVQTTVLAIDHGLTWVPRHDPTSSDFLVGVVPISIVRPERLFERPTAGTGLGEFNIEMTHTEADPIHESSVGSELLLLVSELWSVTTIYTVASVVAAASEALAQALSSPVNPALCDRSFLSLETIGVGDVYGSMRG